MGRDRGGKTRGAQSALEQSGHRAGRQAPSARVHEERLSLAGKRLIEAAPPFRARRKVLAQGLLRLFPEGDDALFAAFARDARQARGEIHVLEIQARGLGDAQAGRVEELEERAVALEE